MSHPALVALVLLAGSSSNQYTPAFPGGIVAWLICNARKRQQIGGWLLFYYWQLYSGVVMTILFLVIGFQTYVPESFDDPHLYRLFLATTLPSLLISALEIAVATMMISVRTWDLVRLLRVLMILGLIATVVATAIDVKYFPDNLVFDFLIIVPGALWLAYFFVSRRVKHVFKSNDWDVAVNTIYPLSPTIAT